MDSGGREIHRIGGANIDNLRLKQREEGLDPPGISVLRSPTPTKAAEEMRAAYPEASGLQESTKTIASATIDGIRSAGFEVIPKPSKRLPSHHRIIHPDGVAGFTDENLRRLAEAFTESTED